MATNFWKNLVWIALGTAIICLGSCTETPTDEQLEVWRKEAIAGNAKIVADQGKNQQQNPWNLVIQGETTNNQTVTLNWDQLIDLATTTVRTTDANYVVQPNKVFEFKGIRVSTLLEQMGVKSSVTDITFVCYDGYQVTVKLDDLRNYPIILAVARDNQAIQRDSGGPIYLVFPYSQYPNIKRVYDDSSWAFYVSHIVVGTEKAGVRLGNSELKLSDLDKLPQTTITNTVGYPIGWPSNKIKLHGVSMQDILGDFNIKLTPQGQIIVRGKAGVYHSSSNPVSLTAANLQECVVILATRWGDQKLPITSKMGGPVTLAFGEDCQDKIKNRRWVTFVEELITQP
ncbi:molybdopterin-dependent oxidoreductase [Cronbergia sp. UHCC 0137]|uniref:molybdopterin-dependent oxidoreductase n=1 Tax=Cronbergia sp. UHCC 0137 TaxID=3110239 RepID=UPI002B2089EC|nr:molybdopterin-dependent oxidoreductase [Cronbergia sp. UHCC 0137]MEA5620644.1 molybdopterin-dependent oxidoreductase [Cronbergia sp. UHCC 0137]